MNAPVRLEQVRRTGIRELGEEKSALSALWHALEQSWFAAERRGDGGLQRAAGACARF